MNIRDAVILVLEESDTPLHVNEITERILSRKFWITSGKTPVATVGARIYSDIKKNKDESPFILHAPATFGLKKTGSLRKAGTGTKSGPSVTPATKSQSKTTFSFTDSAQMVLEQFADRQPMHYRAITDKAVEMGWLSSEGEKLQRHPCTHGLLTKSSVLGAGASNLDSRNTAGDLSGFQNGWL